MWEGLGGGLRMQKGVSPPVPMDGWVGVRDREREKAMESRYGSGWREWDSCYISSRADLPIRIQKPTALPGLAPDHRDFSQPSCSSAQPRRSPFLPLHSSPSAPRPPDVFLFPSPPPRHLLRSLMALPVAIADATSGGCAGRRRPRVCGEGKERVARIIGVSDLGREGRVTSPLVAGPLLLLSPSLKQQKREGGEDKQKYYVNMGYAIRTLREEFPVIFYREPSFDIFRGGKLGDPWQVLNKKGDRSFEL
ncbi:hypothetical protein Taro_027418 [Colocasia esculenta]|uniref:Uncharacterized protein n=1 Tax=Colocasia esculenta TaxID=4460 RepID=A0A843VDW9_COLES|nr:hypothetical protein [Colocasia esculenta]